ncbi:MAG: lysine transporter LysE [Leifsonia sp.]|nr:lysine transporter LysE [Leifsonia sp.]
MTPETVVALLVFLFALAYSPGPGNAFFAAIGASRGLRAAVPALVGYHLATLVVTAAIGLGVGVAVLQDPTVATVLALAGSLYVLWLALAFVRSARATPRESTGHEHPDGDAGGPARIGFWAGALVLLLNPKAYSIIAVMFVQFLTAPSATDAGAVLTLTVVFTLNNLVAFVAWTAAGRALGLLFRSERSRRWIDYGFAVILAAVAIWMAVPVFT